MTFPRLTIIAGANGCGKSTLTTTASCSKTPTKSPAPILDEEDEETLAAIDEGIRDAKAGRTVPAEEVRKRLPNWVTKRA